MDLLKSVLVVVIVAGVLEFLGIPALSGLAWLAGLVREGLGYTFSVAPDIQGVVSS